MSTKKPRAEAIQFRVQSSGTELEIDFDAEAEAIIDIRGGNIEGRPHHIRSYERPKGDKVLSDIPLNSRKLPFSSYRALKENFDCLVAIDTNTKHIHGNNISVTGIYIARPVWVDDGAGFESTFQFTPVTGVEYADLSMPYENYAWAISLRDLVSKDMLKLTERVGVCVDSDLGSLDRYNTKKEPFVENIRLPERWSFIYASADKDPNQLVNKLIRYSDQIASQIIKMHEHGELRLPAQLPSRLYTSKRFITPKNGVWSK